MHTHDSPRRSIALGFAIALLATASMAPSAAAQPDAEPAFIVELRADGAAEIVVRHTFDLTTDAEREAFRRLMVDEAAQANATARFGDRLATVAGEAENATGREMRITDAAIELYRTDDNATGVVTLSATWDGLASVHGETLVVTDPFASGFVPEREFVLRAPDGYVVTSASPSPTERAAGERSWSSEAALDGFAVELRPATADRTTDSGETSTPGQPGFGAGIAIVAVTLAVGVAARRRPG